MKILQLKINIGTIKNGWDDYCYNGRIVCNTKIDGKSKQTSFFLTIPSATFKFEDVWFPANVTNVFLQTMDTFKSQYGTVTDTIFDR